MRKETLFKGIFYIADNFLHGYNDENENLPFNAIALEEGGRVGLQGGPREDSNDRARFGEARFFLSIFSKRN